jgi:hypothetical protein
MEWHLSLKQRRPQNSHACQWLVFILAFCRTVATRSKPIKFNGSLLCYVQMNWSVTKRHGELLCIEIPFGLYFRAFAVLCYVQRHQVSGLTLH